jgi:hypothetical protein
MSKIDILKQQNQQLDMSFIDIIDLLMPKSKYTEMVVNLTKYNPKSALSSGDYDEIIKYVNNVFGTPLDELKQLSNHNIWIIQNLINMLPYSLREGNNLRKFIEYNERGLIDNKDLTSYKSTEDILRQISVAEVKLLNKELIKQVHKMYENDEWLVLRPLTRESSIKYGSGTRWCTASTEDDWPFYRYTRRGILIYTINKKTGQKVAAFKNTDPQHEHELSFWNAIDTRIDSYEADLPEFIMKLIFNEFKTTATNNDITPEQWRVQEDLKKEIWLEEPMSIPTPTLLGGEYTRTTGDQDIIVNRTVSVQRAPDTDVTEAYRALENEIINHLTNQEQNEQH